MGEDVIVGDGLTVTVTDTRVVGGVADPGTVPIELLGTAVDCDTDGVFVGRVQEPSRTKRLLFKVMGDGVHDRWLWSIVNLSAPYNGLDWKVMTAFWRQGGKDVSAANRVTSSDAHL